MKQNKKILTAVLLVTFILLGVTVFFKSKDMNIIEKSRDTFSDSAAETPEDWRLILVNNDNSIPIGYETELTQLSNGIYIDSRIYPDLQKMFDDARGEGIYPIVGEGYRTHEEQQNMMQNKIAAFIDEGYSEREAKKLAKDWVAEPGKSEHELGIALDINADISVSSNEEVYNWLAGNAYKYGFILRYPPGKEDITGIDYEPWHYRYVGHEAAMEIYTQQLTLEEYLS